MTFRRVMAFWIAASVAAAVYASMRRPAPPAWKPDPPVAAPAAAAPASHPFAPRADRRALCARARALLGECTARYQHLFSRGIEALGRTRYPSAFAGLDALSQAGSAANRWKTYHSWLAGSDLFSAANQARVGAQNLFDDDPPAAIGDWFADVNDLDADLRAWTEKATSWQISEISTRQLSRYAAKVRADARKVPGRHRPGALKWIHSA